MTRMAATLAIGLVVLTVPALLINLYFASLILGRWPRLRQRLGGLFRACGADTMLTGRLAVPWPYLVVAAASVLVGLYLVHALVVELRQPCPL